MFHAASVLNSKTLFKRYSIDELKTTSQLTAFLILREYKLPHTVSPYLYPPFPPHLYLYYLCLLPARDYIKCTSHRLP